MVGRGKDKGEYWVKIRYSHTPSQAMVLKKKDVIEVDFYEPQFAPTPGQIAVFYTVDRRIIGSGFIEEVLK